MLFQQKKLRMSLIRKYYSEPNIYNDKRGPDGLILEDNNFINQRLTKPQTGEYLRDRLELNPENLDQVKGTQFDFTNDISNQRKTIRFRLFFKWLILNNSKF